MQQMMPAGEGGWSILTTEFLCWFCTSGTSGLRGSFSSQRWSEHCSARPWKSQWSSKTWFPLFQLLLTEGLQDKTWLIFLVPTLLELVLAKALVQALEQKGQVLVLLPVPEKGIASRSLPDSAAASRRGTRPFSHRRGSAAELHPLSSSATFCPTPRWRTSPPAIHRACP